MPPSSPARATVDSPLYRVLAGLLAVLPPACAAPADADDTGASESSGGSGDTGVTEYPEALVGSFQLQLVAPVPASDTAGKTALVGKVYDGPSPAQIVWERGSESGDCRLSTPRVPFCATPCGGSAVCVEDDTCAPYPAAGSVGTVTVKGVAIEGGAAEFTMDPVANTYQPAAGVKLLYPPFAEGDALSLSAAGDVIPGFTLTARGIAPLELADAAVQLAADAPVALTWTAAADPARSRIHVKLDISHHGGTKGMIECDTADDGALELPAALVSELLDLGVAGFPAIEVTRRSIGSAAIGDGRVDLVVSSSVERPVEIDGLQSCSADEDCDAGQTCQADLTCK